MPLSTPAIRFGELPAKRKKLTRFGPQLGFKRYFARDYLGMLLECCSMIHEIFVTDPMFFVFDQSQLSPGCGKYH